MAEESSSTRRHRFDDLFASQEASLLQEAVPHKTMRANQFWVRTLLSFCREKGILLDLSTCSAETLDDCLKKFYFSLKTKKGEVYQRSSYVSARGAIQRHLVALKRPFNLRLDKEFRASNQILDSVLKKHKRDGLLKPVQHKEAISEVEKSRLEEYFKGVLDTNDT